ncbi:MAG: SGNH/GDSL hydrolase family protein [Candidatus Faecousia sp.]|nr:SGNH/GDSL hydrolase family protein [Candidatus Faecousia sp.]
MIDFEKGMVNRGNWYAIQQVMDYAAGGKEVTVGFLGGSITQGSLASIQENCYASRVFKWWSSHFPKVNFINAGIGGTTSQFGVARVEEDLLKFHPDLIFVEFSVNDEGNPFFRETYEALVRRILSSGAAVMLIHNVRYDNMVSAEDIHVEIGRHYHLPCVSMRSSIYPLVASGKIPNRQITPDDLHPNDLGHEMVASVITYFLEKIRTADKKDAPAFTMPEPLTENQYEYSLRYQNHNSSPVLEGFVPDHTPQEHITQMFRRGYTACNFGDRITFQVEGTGVAVQYRKSVRKPAPIARVVVDDCQEKAVLLDGNFDEDWGDCLHIDTVLFHGERKRHKVEITIAQAHEDDAVLFYLVSVIGSHGK